MAGEVSAKKRIWGWYFFDWASQPYNTLLLTFIFGPYFAQIGREHFIGTGMEEEAAKAATQAYWGYGLALASLVVAVLAPLLGAIADGSGRRMPWIWLFSVLYVVGATGLWWLMPGARENLLLWTAILFGIGFIGMEFTTIFTNSLMPSLSQTDEIGTISGKGFAFGYLGGLVGLVIMLLLFAENGATGRTLIGIEPLFGLDPAMREGTRFVGPFTALWYIVFMVPFFLWVREPKGPRMKVNLPLAWRQLVDLVKSLKHRTSLASYLGSSLCYRDALNALFAFGGFYATNVLDWSITSIGVFGLLGGVTAMVSSYIFGRIDTKIGPKPVITWSIAILIVTCCVIVGTTRDSVFGIALAGGSGLPDILFYICGGVIGAAAGPLQASSRTLLLRHTTPERATEAFGIFALSGKVASFISPLLVAVVSQVSQSPRIGITPVILLFVLGLILMIWVKPRGERT